MKMVKKILLGLAASAAVLSLVSCGLKDDDPEGAIKGSGSKYTVSYTNSSTKAQDYYRAYNTTTLKHSGALVKVTFDDPSVCKNSKMGLIFDLKDSKNTNAGDGARDFFIIGIGKSEVYVSKFENIVDIQEKNFGATTSGNATAGEPTETEYIKLTGGNINLVNATNDDGSISLYVYCKADKDGNYKFALLAGEPTDSSVTMKIDDIDINALPSGVSKIDLSNVIKGSGCTIANNVGTIADAVAAVTDDSKIVQNKLAVYAMIDASSTLNGSWKFCGTYHEAEEIEE